MKKFVAVMNIPSPYRLHLFNVMAKQLEERGVEFHCHFMAKGHADRPKSWLNPKIDFPHTYWPDYGFGQHHFNPGLIWELVRRQPEYMIIGSSFDTATGTAIALLNSKSVKCVWAEGNTRTTGQMHGFKGWFKRLVYSWFEFALVPGSEGVKYIGLHQALTKRKMPTPDVLPNIVDETRFVPVPRNKIKDTRTCLIPARLEPVKGLVPFFELLTPEMLTGWKIRLMGQGPLRAEIEEVLGQRGIKKFVEIVDYVPYDEMPQNYAAADLLLLPSVYDPNPLSAIEALHAGLPLALSNMAGNITEAVTEGVNGWSLPVMDRDAYLSKLKEVFSTPLATLQEMGKKSKLVNAQFWDSEKAVKSFLDVMIGAQE